MPKAFSLTYGLDLDTEVSSFWAWLKDTLEIMRGGEGAKQVRQLVEAQREEIERLAAAEADPEQARFVLGVAVALVGFHYASQQKLLNALKELGVIDSRKTPPIFDTIIEPTLEDGPPR